MTEPRKPGRKAGTSDKPFRKEVRLSVESKGQLDQACALSSQLNPLGKPASDTSIIEAGIALKLGAIRRAIRDKDRVDKG